MTSSQQPLAKRYKLLRQLAAGSYAETWLANDLMLNRHVAIKLLHASEGDPEQETDRFLREARIAAAVSHANIVAVFDAGSKGDRPFLVMEWVDGASLKQQILRSRRMSIERAIEITAELLDGLSSIHEQGIIHRDVKPQNIMINEFGTVKLTDFGIARLVSEAEARADGTTAGSAAYMAPEQAQGHPVSPAADIYATGVILFEMLTGRLPFRHEDPQRVMLQHIADPVPRPRRLNPGIPIELESIVLQALSKDPLNRYQSADEMREALINVRRKLPVRRPVQLQPFEEPSPLAVPRFAWMAASITLMFVMLAGATSLAVRDSDASQNIAESPDVTEVATVTPVEEPEPASAPTEPPITNEPDVEQEREFAEWEDDSVIRGEIIIEGAPEHPVGVNRPAPSGVASDDDDDADETEQEVASTDNQPTWQPTPEPEPQVEATPTPEPSEDEQSESATEDDAEADDGESDSEQPGNEDASDEVADNDGTGNGDSSSEENQQNDADREDDDEDTPAANQGRDDEDGDDESDSTTAQENGDDRDRASDQDDDQDSTTEHQDVTSDDDDAEEQTERKQDRPTNAVAVQHQEDSASDDDDVIQNERDQDPPTNAIATQRQDSSSDDDDDDAEEQTERKQDRSTNGSSTQRQDSSSDDDDDDAEEQTERKQDRSPKKPDNDNQNKKEEENTERKTIDNEKRNTDKTDKNQRSNDKDDKNDREDRRSIFFAGKPTDRSQLS